METDLREAFDALEAAGFSVSKIARETGSDFAREYGEGMRCSYHLDEETGAILIRCRKKESA